MATPELLKAPEYLQRAETFADVLRYRVFSYSDLLQAGADTSISPNIIEVKFRVADQKKAKSTQSKINDLAEKQQGRMLNTWDPSDWYLNYLLYNLNRAQELTKFYTHPDTSLYFVEQSIIETQEAIEAEGKSSWSYLNRFAFEPLDATPHQTIAQRISQALLSLYRKF